LQKVMAAAGIGSRRECEQLILAGRVEVDGQIVTELGTRVNLTKNDVRFDGESLSPSRPRYYLVNKPVGVVSTNRDQQGRPRVIDLVPPTGHLFTVGRLDRTSEGLILVTNDGELANGLAHPRYEIPKIYRVTMAGHPTHEALMQLRRGVWIAEGQVQAAELTIKKQQGKNTILEMVLTEGRNREIRRMAAKIGHKVLELKRIALGPLRLGEIPTGAYRELTSREVGTLTSLVTGKARRVTKKRPPQGRRGAGQVAARKTMGAVIGGKKAAPLAAPKRSKTRPSKGRKSRSSD
jgi:23S rRNA pseudouridine2605 synthase